MSIKSKVTRKLMDSGTIHSNKTVRLLVAICEQPTTGISVTQYCEDLKISRAYWYKASKVHEKLIKEITDAKS